MEESSKESILVVDDQVEILNTMQRLLRHEFHVEVAASGPEALDLLDGQAFAVILSDQRMPGMDGVTFLARSLEKQPEAVRIMITGYADIDATIEAVNRAKIYQYIAKPFEPDELKQIINNAVERFRLKRQNRILQQQLMQANEQLRTEKFELQRQVEKQLELGNFIGSSPKILSVLKLVQKVMDTPTTVLLLGETGTGKELLARIIHYNSNRREHMFVAQNCGAIPDTLLQSELFGHVKGAFTGAVKDKKGLFEMAHQGTVFLDEIGDTSAALQLGLLRVLQEGEIKPLGSHITRKVDVRVIAATNRDLLNEVREGRFREDLYYRLNVFPITLPPLRERRQDIPDLVSHFLKKYSQRIKKHVTGILPETLDRLCAADYPGNIRELENEIERMITLADDNTSLSNSLLSQRFKTAASAGDWLENIREDNLKYAIAKLEQALILKSLKHNQGNILRSARQLGISRVGLHKMLKRHNIRAEQFKTKGD